MPKIVRIINRFNLGGPIYNAAYLTKYLSPEFETLLIGGMKDDTEASSEYILKNMGIEYQLLSNMKRTINPLNDLSAYNTVKKIIKKFKPDIVHTHAAKAGALGRIAAYRCHVPVLVHTFHGHIFHSYFGDIKSSVYKIIERNLAKKTTAIIAISEKQKGELINEHKITSLEKKVHVIPLGFDLNRFQENFDEKRKKFREEYKLSSDEIAIGIIGRLVPVKNHSLFIEAIRFVKENTPIKIKAFIVGDGEERQKLESMAREFGLINHLIFTSWNKEIDKVYPGLDIVCLTSFNEGTPVSLVEAQAANLPIVSTKVGGVEDVVIENYTALLSEIADKNKFCENILRMVKSAELRKSMSIQGREYVKKKFHYSRLISDTQKLYRMLLKEAYSQ